MTVEQFFPARPLDPAHEQIQRDHELNAALEAARTLQARLELLGDRAADVAIVHSLRDSLARDVVVNGEENRVTVKRFFKEKDRVQMGDDNTQYIGRKVPER